MRKTICPHCKQAYVGSFEQHYVSCASSASEDLPKEVAETQDERWAIPTWQKRGEGYFISVCPLMAIVHPVSGRWTVELYSWGPRGEIGQRVHNPAQRAHPQPDDLAARQHAMEMMKELLRISLGRLHRSMEQRSWVRVGR